MLPDKGKAPPGAPPEDAQNRFIASIMTPSQHAITAQMLVEPLRLKRNGRGYSGVCPLCQYPSNSLSVTQRGERLLINCHACRRPEVFQVCLNGLGFSPIRPSTSSDHALHDRLARQDTRTYASNLYAQAKPAADTLAERYLQQRGIDTVTYPLPAGFRFLASARYDQASTFPALIAPVVLHDGTFLGIQRIFLHTECLGQAPVPTPKKSLGALQGGSVQLAPATETLGLCEGIETGLAARQLSGLPVWACLSTAGLTQVLLPPLPLASNVVIFADHDANQAGQIAARTLAKRLLHESRTVRIVIPETVGQDMCDLLKEI